MSEIFVDTIRKTGGTLGTDIRIKNTSVYESDGGTSVTKNLVQSLTKAWAGIDSSANLEDSFNISSGDDDGTGNYGLNFTSNMANVNYTHLTSGEYDAGVQAGFVLFNYDANEVLVTSNFPVKGYKTNDTALVDVKYSIVAIFGDLA